MLSFLLSFQIQSCKSSQILLTHSFVNGRAAPYTFPVVVGRVGPPVGFHFNITQNHVFYGRRKSWDLNEKGKKKLIKFIL